MKYYQKCVTFACNYFKNSSASPRTRTGALLLDPAWGLPFPRPPMVLPHPKPPSAAYAYTSPQLNQHGVGVGRWNMIYGVAQPSSNIQQRRSLRSLLYATVIPRSQRTANVSRDNDTAHAQSAAPRSNIRRPVISMLNS